MSPFRLSTRRCCFRCALVFWFALAGAGSLSAGSPPAVKARRVTMTLYPAAAPAPALKYLLLPAVRDLKPGNAALFYQRAHSPEWWNNFNRTGYSDKVASMLEMPLGKMPRDPTVLLAGALKEVDRGARREYCDWELTPRIREDGPMLLLPDLHSFRQFGQMLALRARLEMVDGHLDQAVATFQTALALGRHVGDGPTLIHALVGVAVCQMTLTQIEEFMQLDQAPNLYWALLDLPRPFIDLRRPAQGEKVMVDGMFPEIRDALHDPTFPPVAVQTINKYLERMRHLGSPVLGDRFQFTLAAAHMYPAAKAFLTRRGFTAEQIRALPVTQAALMYSLSLYDDFYDETFKWLNAPYWEARPGLKLAETKLKERSRDEPEAALLASAIVPAATHVLYTKVRLDRRFALLQVVEALRLHAARDGTLPERLEDVRHVPLPLDPVTGKAFDYVLEEGRATLYAPPPPGEAASDRNALSYELTLATKK